MPIFHDPVQRPPLTSQPSSDNTADNFANVHIHHGQKVWMSDWAMPQPLALQDDQESRPLSREALIQQIKRGGSPSIAFKRGFDGTSSKQASGRNSPLLGPSDTLLPPLELQESSRGECKDVIDHRMAGIEIERPRSALHSGDFREDKGIGGQKDDFPERLLSTSPVAPWHADFPAFRGPTCRQDDPASRLRAATQSSLSKIVFMPPTSPLVQATNNPDLDFSPRPFIARRSRSPQKDHRRHTFSPRSMQTYNGPFYDSMSRDLPTRSSTRRESTFYQAHQPRRTIAPFSQSSPQTPSLRPRRLSNASESSPLHHAPMVGSYEESILRGRMSTIPSRPLNFVAQIGVLGKGNCKASLRCPPHVTIPFPAVYYSYDGVGGPLMNNEPSPYVGLVDLENRLVKVPREESRKRKRYNSFDLGSIRDEQELPPRDMPRLVLEEQALKHQREQLKNRSQSAKAPYGGCYRIPQQGQLQIIIKSPHKTAVKLFLVPYDVSDMEPGQKTFIRQRSYSAGPIIDMPVSARRNLGSDRPEAAISTSEDPNERPVLRYLIHLHICCTGKGRFYLYKSIRVVFANRVPDGKERLRNEIQFPEPRYSTYKHSQESAGSWGNTATSDVSTSHNLDAERVARRKSTPMNLSFDWTNLEVLDDMSPDVRRSHFPRMSSDYGAVRPIPFSLDRLETVESRPTSRNMMDTTNPFRKQIVSPLLDIGTSISPTSLQSVANTAWLTGQANAHEGARSSETRSTSATQGLITRQLNDLSVEMSNEYSIADAEGRY